MKKLSYLLLIVFLLISCGPKKEKVQKTMEDGVEVILNHLEPYKIKGEPSALHLEEEFRIDTERREIAQLGLMDISGFDVNSEGEIFIFKPPTSEDNFVLKFNQEGYFVKAFGQKGVGPGMIQRPFYNPITGQDELPILDYAHKFLMFGKDGDFLNETHIYVSSLNQTTMVLPLENGSYIIRKSLRSSFTEDVNFILGLYRLDGIESKEVTDFKKIMELDRYTSYLSYFRQRRGEKIRYPDHVSIWCVSKERIFVGNEKQGYEIRVYDFDGNLRRKIKKDYEPVKITEEFKKKINQRLEKAPPDYREKVYIPQHWPPFQSCFTDEEGRLFVMTYEKGENPGEYVHDIFSSDGAFIGKTNLEYYSANRMTPLKAMAKNDCLYCLREKENGNKELVVYKMKWK